jgi:hypothetical protein
MQSLAGHTAVRRKRNQGQETQTSAMLVRAREGGVEQDYRLREWLAGEKIIGGGVAACAVRSVTTVHRLLALWSTSTSDTSLGARPCVAYWPLWLCYNSSPVVRQSASTATQCMPNCPCPSMRQRERASVCVYVCVYFDPRTVNTHTRSSCSKCTTHSTAPASGIRSAIKPWWP